MWSHLPLLVRASSKESVEYILQALWRTRRTGLDAADRQIFRDILQLPNDSDLDPVRASGARAVGGGAKSSSYLISIALLLLRFELWPCSQPTHAKTAPAVLIPLELVPAPSPAPALIATSAPLRDDACFTCYVSGSTSLDASIMEEVCEIVSGKHNKDCHGKKLGCNTLSKLQQQANHTKAFTFVLSLSSSTVIVACQASVSTTITAAHPMFASSCGVHGQQQASKRQSNLSSSYSLEDKAVSNCGDGHENDGAENDGDGTSETTTGANALKRPEVKHARASEVATALDFMEPDFLVHMHAFEKASKSYYGHLVASFFLSFKSSGFLKFSDNFGKDQGIIFLGKTTYLSISYCECNTSTLHAPFLDSQELPAWELVGLNRVEGWEYAMLFEKLGVPWKKMVLDFFCGRVSVWKRIIASNNDLQDNRWDGVLTGRTTLRSPRKFILRPIVSFSHHLNPCSNTYRSSIVFLAVSPGQATSTVLWRLKGMYFLDCLAFLGSRCKVIWRAVFPILCCFEWIPCTLVLLVCLRVLIRRCVNDNVNKDEIQKLFPAEVLPELQRLLTLLLQKFQKEWRQDISKDQVILPRLKSMTWNMANQSEEQTEPAAVINLRLHCDAQPDVGERDVKFQLAKDTMEMMLKSMYCIKDQLSEPGETPDRHIIQNSNPV
ncbi:hypothetical protein C2S51_028977 [Perilla frutescens var. frutescens]|nr:hypothetical protein C2S51_028977 [Perilla frutescens var. frutescens]